MATTASNICPAQGIAYDRRCNRLKAALRRHWSEFCRGRVNTELARRQLITKLAQKNTPINLLADTGAKLVVNKSISNGDAFLPPVFEPPSLCWLFSRLRVTAAGMARETRSSAKFASSLPCLRLIFS
ncbi:hypothetical protein QUB75_07930 [Microcoleus sp. K1-B6]|uniref:hypothetical protein n=1 Tax=unclassified Microcoleus TaxID=2642155 RepID=UPI002FD535D1